MERTELVEDRTAVLDKEEAKGSLMIQLLTAKVTPFSKDVIVAGIQQFSSRYCIVCQSKPVSVSVYKRAQLVFIFCRTL